MARFPETVELLIILWQLLDRMHLIEGGPVLVTIALLVTAVRTRNATVAYAAVMAALVVLAQA
ncbi:hypothetical protein H9Y04_29295 [Streptomyces sp. TRM66268-LWL]|uniref:Uncharacterized protein n=1 Tax=Streptomyces polyasparticus TaxID=2767826 RepID=A0ABR7SPL8_9ACTN|nr:hypothetical protein [Streptomyces polyasparticus]MBC9716635.1 hypothetical protein [Streptomyces polyasparticus]